jgi:hypothetical protein
MTILAATHGISLIDAIISVNHINNNIKKKSYFISVFGAAILPSLGHGYIGSPRNWERGWLYNFGELISVSQDRVDIANSIRAVSVIDAAASTYYYNRKAAKRTAQLVFLPGYKSCRLMLVKRF